MPDMLFCESCSRELYKYGEPALVLFEEICIYATLHDEYIELDDDKVALRFLEIKGYVVTTEVGKDSVLVKPKGLQLIDDEENCYFHVCVNRIEHHYALDM